MDRRSVRANIERLAAENPEAPVIIQAHPESTTDVMIHIMDSARQAGVYNVAKTPHLKHVVGSYYKDRFSGLFLCFFWSA